ncbi:hypothetical protein N9Z02_02815, partial [Akkermansiaceae bacterium]|nr:hypothetical protein [Akkermansiaceae bacterium]
MLKTLLLSALLIAPLAAAPEGFTSIFNGKDFSGWWGASTENPAKYLALPPLTLEQKKKGSLHNIYKHWTVKDGIIHND